MNTWSTTFIIFGVSDADKEPSPNNYEKQEADKVTFPKAPSYSHQFRRSGTILWAPSGKYFIKKDHGNECSDATEQKVFKEAWGILKSKEFW